MGRTSLFGMVVGVVILTLGPNLEAADSPEQEAAETVSENPVLLSVAELKANGAFGFPQEKAKVFCDRDDLRFSVCSNDKYLCIQAILWKDGDESLGPARGSAHRDRKIGDTSTLMLDVDANGQPTPNTDRQYFLNPWPEMTGLHYQIMVRANAWTGLQNDTRGRGNIEYVQTDSEKRIRVETCLVPLREISKKLGDKIRLCYYGYSPKPKFSVTSAEMGPDVRVAVSWQVPHDKYHTIVLRDCGAIQIGKNPRARAADDSDGLVRTWKDHTGRYELEAKLLRVEGEAVVLLKSDNTTVRVPIEKLSSADRRFVESQK